MNSAGLYYRHYRGKGVVAKGNNAVLLVESLEMLLFIGGLEGGESTCSNPYKGELIVGPLTSQC